MSYDRYSIVDCVVTGHKHYGVLVRVIGTDERGFVDRSEMGNQAVAESDWPPEASTIRCVVLGRTRDGRLRFTSRPRDVALVETLPHPGDALRHWIAVREAARSETGSLAGFLETSYAVSILWWAMQHRPDSADYATARRAADLLPAGKRLDEPH